MRLLWISCLLIGSISCGPVGKGSGSNSGGTRYMPSFPASSWGVGSVGSAEPAPEDADSGSIGGYVSFGGASQPDGYDGGAPEGGYGGYYAGASEEEGYGFASAPEDEDWSSESATETDAYAVDDGPVFSDVSDLEPVYSFSSRSRYQRGRSVFAQTRYIPGEPVVPPMPIYKPIIRRVPAKQSSPPPAPPAKAPAAPVKAPPAPAKAPIKGGY